MAVNHVAGRNKGKVMLYALSTCGWCAKTKELLGLVSSLVLRCDDCVNYHLIQCHDKGITDQELEEALAIGLVVGGSITIPHLRRALQSWDELKQAR